MLYRSPRRAASTARTCGKLAALPPNRRKPSWRACVCVCVWRPLFSKFPRPSGDVRRASQRRGENRGRRIAPLHTGQYLLNTGAPGTALRKGAGSPYDRGVDVTPSSRASRCLKEIRRGANARAASANRHHRYPGGSTPNRLLCNRRTTQKIRLIAHRTARLRYRAILPLM